jgi:hypothetical protein
MTLAAALLPAAAPTRAIASDEPAATPSGLTVVERSVA